MLSINTNTQNLINAPVRRTYARVEFYQNSTLFHTSRAGTDLVSFKVERVGDENKFFGFGICQKANIKVLDTDRELDFQAGMRVRILVSADNANYYKPYPDMTITEINRDENTNQLSITAYDDIYEATKYVLDDVGIEPPYSIYRFANACALKLGLYISCINCSPNEYAFQLYYKEGANYEGNEKLRDVLTDIAEATQTIYYIKGGNLVFRRLDKNSGYDFLIDKSKYITLDTKTNRRLGKICSATELGDNVIASTSASGSTQNIFDNPFYENREDIATILETAISTIGGLTINQFNCKWRGNFALECGDKIGIEEKDGSISYAFIINDSVSYDGAFSETTQWEYPSGDGDVVGNPTTLGDALNQTYARVNKIDKEIELVVKDNDETRKLVNEFKVDIEGIHATVSSMEAEVDSYSGSINAIVEKQSQIDITLDSITQTVDNVRTETLGAVDGMEAQIEVVEQNISALQLNADSITASVENIRTETSSSIGELNDDINVLSNKVAATMTSDEVKIAIETEMANGVNKVSTTTGYTFDDNGLTIDKSGSEMKTIITDDGMTVYRNSDEMLVANNVGVEATNLHARTYLIIGTNSRFEDYGYNRTACFYIGEL